MKSNKKRMGIVPAIAAVVLVIGIFVGIAPLIIIAGGINHSALATTRQGVLEQDIGLAMGEEEGFAGQGVGVNAPVVLSGDNIYIAWWTNNTENGNNEVMFRASNDGGATFGDKMNLSNTTDADSLRVEIAGEGADVVVTWWERNQTSDDVPVARISNDGGATFGPMIRLGMNGTIESTAEQEVAAEAGEL